MQTRDAKRQLEDELGVKQKEMERFLEDMKQVKSNLAEEVNTRSACESKIKSLEDDVAERDQNLTDAAQALSKANYEASRLSDQLKQSQTREAGLEEEIKALMSDLKASKQEQVRLKSIYQEECKRALQLEQDLESSMQTSKERAESLEKASNEITLKNDEIKELQTSLSNLREVLRLKG